MVYVSPSAPADPELQNELNYIAWKNEHAQRRRQLQTQFNIWRAHQHDRMSNHHHYKTEAVGQTEQLKQILHQRLEKACACDTCRVQASREVANSSDTKSTLLRPSTLSTMPNVQS